jgi:hypothetical protein
MVSPLSISLGEFIYDIELVLVADDENDQGVSLVRKLAKGVYLQLRVARSCPLTYR